MSDFYPHLERRKQREQPKNRLLWVLIIVVPAVVLSLLGPPLGRLAHHIAAEYEVAETAASAAQTRENIAPKVALDDPFSNRRELPQIRGGTSRRVAGPTWVDESAARVVDEPDLGFAFRIHNAWVCRVVPAGEGVNGKCFGSKVSSVLHIRIVACPGECSGADRDQLDNNATQALTGDPVELQRCRCGNPPDSRTRYREISTGSRYSLVATHTYHFDNGWRHLTLMSEGPQKNHVTTLDAETKINEAEEMQRAINDALSQAR